MTVTHGLPSAHPQLVSAVEYLYDIGELNSTLDIIHFIEKPYRYPELLTLWDDEVCRQGEAQDEFKVRAL